MGLQEALEELRARADAIGGLDSSDEEHLAVVVGFPEELTRKLLSGYVPAEDTDAALDFLDDAAKAITALVTHSSGPYALRAGLKFSVAQFLVVGVALGRQR